MKVSCLCKMSVWFALLVSFLPLSCEAYQVVNESTKVFRFSLSNGNDTLCLQDHPDTPCQSLKMATQILSTYKNNIRLEIEENCSLTEVLQVQNDTSFITIAGILGNSGSFPTIECMGNAGINVTGTHNFSITTLSFKKCSIQGDHIFPYSSTIVVANSQDISLINVTISHSPNNATYFINCMGTVLLNYVVMEYNGHIVHGMYERVYSGGLCIEQTGTDELGEGVHYNISHCVFKFNKAPYDHDNNHTTSRDHIGYGGAMYVYFRRTARNSTLVIEFSDFVENTGKRGGGMHIHFGDKAGNNEVYIHRCNFSNNTARYSGGALAIDYSSYSFENLVNLTFCNFTRNYAEFGGGLAILSEYGKTSSGNTSSGNSIVASKCTWWNNYGTLSSAIDIAPIDPDQDRTYFLPEVTFLDCTISHNKLGYYGKTPTKLDSVHQTFHSPRVHHIYSGVVLVTRFRVSFGGNTLFYKNDYSALVVVSATVTFKKDSYIVFDGNVAYNGGAVGLYGFSQITLSRDLVLKFVKNYALNHGGAIVYRTIDQHSLTSSKNCFFRHQDLGNKSLVQTTHVIFENNTAEVAGNSIYSESFTDCYYQCLNSGDHRNSTYYEYWDITNCLGNFSIPYQLVSGGRSFVFNDTTPYNFSVIPGDQADVPFKVVDDFNQTVKPMMSVNRAINGSSDVLVNQIYTLNTTITPTGEPGKFSYFSFSVLGVRQFYFYFSITLLPCPPGFYFDNMSKVCKCGAGDNGYEDIIRCSTFRAKPKSGLWVGYIPPNSKHFRDLYFAPCSGPICSSWSFRSLTDDSNDLNLLPKNADDLNSNICDKNRFGILCGRCANKSSTYYHSKKFECKHSQLCYLGWLFYILAEVLPLVIFFVVIITFDFSFTSGRAVGFIFFAQHLDKLTIHINEYFTYLRTPSRVFYGLFNLEFFEIESLSFCPWYSSQVLDVIALKYVTIILALGLVFLLITLLHNNCCSCICRLRWKVRARTSIVHGLCAFLVICYAQSSKTAFYILKYSIPSGYNGTTSTSYSYYGGLNYLQGDHLVYAIPSFISVVFLTVLPPLVLLFYPLSLQLLSACRLSEHKFVLKLLQVLRIHKLILFIDCFQSCYMDRHRYFAGLYFVYRIVILICYSINPHGYEFYVYSQIFLIIFLGIHCIIQPYKERLHNILDSLVFFNLCLINALVLVSEQLPYLSHALLLVSSIQLVLIYTPMAVLFGWSSVKAYRHLKNMWLRKKHTLEVAVTDVVDCNRSLSEDYAHSIGSYGSIRS